MLCLISTDAFKLSNDNTGKPLSGHVSEKRRALAAQVFAWRVISRHNLYSRWNFDLTPGSLLCTVTREATTKIVIIWTCSAVATLLMNRRWWQLWIIFEKHKGINLFLPCGRKSSTMFEPNNNTKHFMLRKYVYLSNKEFYFFPICILARLESMLFALQTQHERSWNISTAIEWHISCKAFLNYRMTDWSLHACLRLSFISQHVIHTCITLPFTRLCFSIPNYTRSH